MKPFLPKISKGATRLRWLLVLPLVLLCTMAMAQVTISGKVVDENDKPVKGASVSLDNTLDGATTDDNGLFKFTTEEKGNQTIVATEVSHQNAGQPINVDKDVAGLVLKMKGNKAHDLDQVVITAGSIEATNDKDKTVLKPLDIVTTAGAQADVVRAIQTLPGTQQQGAQTGLFVRGGDASEAAMIVDEMTVQDAFFNTAPGVAARSRFGPFQFKGVAFSSGGYSARYGQALSSVLELNSLDLPDKSNVNLGVNMAGVYASGTHLWKNASIDGTAYYNNLTPFYKLAKTNFNFFEVPVGGGGSTRFVWKPNKDGIFKISVNGSYFTSGVGVPNPFGDTSVAGGDTIDYRIKDQNWYSNASYRQMFKDKFSLYTAASYSYDKSDNSFGAIPAPQNDQRAQYRLEGKYYATSRISLLVGGEAQYYKVNKQWTDTLPQYGFHETQVAAYAEADIAPMTWLAIRPGVRFEHSELLGKNNIAPRLSLAIKTGAYSQVSLAGGMFFQNPDYMYLYYQNPYGMGFQQAIHYIANWQWIRNDRTLRIEGYYKDYKDLELEHYATPFDPNSFRFLYPGITVDNAGKGYAKGIELFWRDRKSLKNLDYWISYSFIDTKREYKNYETMAQPDFISNHNLNVIAKYFIDKISTNVSATYSFATGKPYYDPNPGVAFLSERTPAYHNLSLTLSYLHTIKKWFTVVYLGVDNITNNPNIFGYRYRMTPAGYASEPIKPALYRSIFLGVNFSLTEFSKDEL
ncbi:MAG: TonB-dependent receptor [Bacteroidetes bacterium]|nr:TonB-dependent receptor [Bacteroidota bacterium]